MTGRSQVIKWGDFVRQAATAYEAGVGDFEFSKSFLGKEVRWEGVVSAVQRRSSNPGSVMVDMPEIIVALKNGRMFRGDGLVLRVADADWKTYPQSFWRKKIGASLAFHARFKPTQGVFAAIRFFDFGTKHKAIVFGFTLENIAIESIGDAPARKPKSAGKKKSPARHKTPAARKKK